MSNFVIGGSWFNNLYMAKYSLNAKYFVSLHMMEMGGAQLSGALSNAAIARERERLAV